MRTWGDIAGRAYPDVVTVKQVLFEKKILFCRLTVVLALVVAVIDGKLCGFASEASQPVGSPMVIAFGPAGARDELARRLSL